MFKNIFFVLAVTGCITATQDIHASSDILLKRNQIAEDLETLRTTMESAAFDAYARQSREKINSAFATAAESISDDMTIDQAARIFAKAVASAEIAHLRVEWPKSLTAEYRHPEVKLLPFDYKIVDGKAYITKTYQDALSVSPGDQLIAMNGMPMQQVNQRLGKWIGADTAYMHNSVIEMQQSMLLWLEFGSIDSAEIQVSDDQGVRLVTVSGLTRDQLADVGSSDNLLDLSWIERESRMVDDHVAYLRPGPFWEVTSDTPHDNSAFVQFIDDAFEKFAAAGAQSLIIDMRNNYGGDNSFSDPMIAYFADRPFRFFKDFRIKVSPQTTASNAARIPAGKMDDANNASVLMAREYAVRKNGEIFSFDLPFAQPRKANQFKGNVYVLINRHSYSNAANVAAIVQDYGFATLIGEETSDLVSSYGAMESFQLPHSGIKVGYPKAFILRTNGDETPRGAIPDVIIKTPIVEQADDPVLQKALAIAKKPLQEINLGAGAQE